MQLGVGSQRKMRHQTRLEEIEKQESDAALFQIPADSAVIGRAQKRPRANLRSKTIAGGRQAARFWDLEKRE